MKDGRIVHLWERTFTITAGAATPIYFYLAFRGTQNLFFIANFLVLKTYILYKKYREKPGTQNLYFICFNRQPQSLVFRGH